MGVVIGFMVSGGGLVAGFSAPVDESIYMHSRQIHVQILCMIHVNLFNEPLAVLLTKWHTPPGGGGVLTQILNVDVPAGLREFAIRYT